MVQLGSVFWRLCSVCPQQGHYGLWGSGAGEDPVQVRTRCRWGRRHVGVWAENQNHNQLCSDLFLLSVKVLRFKHRKNKFYSFNCLTETCLTCLTFSFFFCHFFTESSHTHISLSLRGPCSPPDVTFLCLKPRRASVSGFYRQKNSFFYMFVELN